MPLLCLYTPLAGDYSSPSRFTRMAMVRAAALATCWPTVAGNESQLLSPGTLPGRQYPQHSPALLAVLGITQTVYLPRGEQLTSAQLSPSVQQTHCQLHVLPVLQSLHKWTQPLDSLLNL